MLRLMLRLEEQGRARPESVKTAAHTVKLDQSQSKLPHTLSDQTNVSQNCRRHRLDQSQSKLTLLDTLLDTRPKSIKTAAHTDLGQTRPESVKNGCRAQCQSRPKSVSTVVLRVGLNKVPASRVQGHHTNTNYIYIYDTRAQTYTTTHPHALKQTHSHQSVFHRPLKCLLHWVNYQ